MTNNSTESNKNADSGFNRDMTTDTPRTDTAFGQGKHGVMKIPYETSCQLERELAALKSEVAELNSLMIGWKQRATMSETDLEASKAEVERLNDYLEIARMSLAQEEKRAIHFQHYCKKAQDMYNYRLVATSEADERAEKAEAKVERLNGLLSDLLILTEKIYWNSNNYKQIKKAYHDKK
jgi:hypothetical protein